MASKKNKRRFGTGRTALGILLLCILLCGCAPEQPEAEAGSENIDIEESYDTETGEAYTRRQFYFFDYFDTTCSVILYLREDQDGKEIEREIEEMLSGYHRLLDAYNGYDGINNIYSINQKAGEQAVEVAPELFELLQFCAAEGQKMDYRTNIAFGAVTKIWKKVISDVSEAQRLQEQQRENFSDLLPKEEDLANAALHCDPDQIVLDSEERTVYLADPELVLDVGAVAKGYVADRLAEYLIEKGIDSACINLGGNLKILGAKKNKGNEEPWLAAIRDPGSDNSGNLPFTLQLSDDIAVVTSGNYERYVIVDGVRYCHLIDPDTRHPVQEMASVSVITKSSLLADFLSTALFTVSVDQGLEILQQFDHADVLWVTGDGQVYYTEGFADYVDEPDQLSDMKETGRE